MRWRDGEFLLIAIVAAILLVMLLVTSVISSMIVVLCDTVATMLQPSSPSDLWSP